MSILKHLCSQCDHSDEFHTGRDCSYGGCRCRATTSAPEPTLIPTWDESGTPVLTVTPPGTRWPDVGRGYVTCSCDACVAAYAAETSSVSA